MKILLISRKVNQTGGIERYVVEMINYFKNRHDVFLLSSDCKINLSSVHKKKISYIQKPFFFHLLSAAFLNAKKAKELKSRLKMDIVCSQGSDSLFTDVVVMHSCHMAWVKFSKRELNEKIKRWINPNDRTVLFLERRVLQRAKKIVAVSHLVKSQILDNYGKIVPPNKIEVIYNGVNFREFYMSKKKRRSTRKKVREKLGIKGGELLLLFVGNYFERKGLRFLLEAIPQIEGKFKLLVIGKDNPKPYLEICDKLKIREKVIFYGVSSNIRNLYNASDIFVFPTLMEPFGLVTFEALAAGLPIITTNANLNGAAEILREGENAFILKDPKDSREIAEKIQVLLNNKKLREKMEERNIRLGRLYSWKNVGKKMEKCFNSLLASSR